MGFFCCMSLSLPQFHMLHTTLHCTPPRLLPRFEVPRFLPSPPRAPPPPATAANLPRLDTTPTLGRGQNDRCSEGIVPFVPRAHNVGRTPANPRCLPRFLLASARPRLGPTAPRDSKGKSDLPRDALIGPLTSNPTRLTLHCFIPRHHHLSRCLLACISTQTLPSAP
jgi:hypothetical protein